MKPHCTAIAATFMATLTALASVPLAWQVTPRTPAPVAFDRHHGETLELRCTFTGFGELPFGQAADIRLWYQTNGMAAAWWSVPASVSSNVLSATFPPSADPGADRLALFFGAPSNAYASAVLRLRHSPGFAPNILPPPDVTSWAEELAAIRAIIDYSTSNADLVATIKSTAPAPSNYETVYNRAMSAIQNEEDPTVPAWAKNPTPPVSGLTTNDVCNIVTNDVVEYGRWVCSPSEVAEGPISLTESGEEDGRYWMIVWFGSRYPIGNKDSTSLTFSLSDGGTNFTVVATRQAVTRNALGLARLIDLPPLTNGLTESIAAKASTNDVQLSPVYGGNGEAFTEWSYAWPEGADGTIFDVTYEGGDWIFDNPDNNPIHVPASQTATNLTFTASDVGGVNYTVSATRTPNPIIGYTLGTQTNKVLASTSITNGLARLSDLPPLTNAIPDTAARAVYDVHDLMWDETESILYWHKIRQGHDEYIAVTNIDLTHPTNAVILKAWREANQ